MLNQPLTIEGRIPDGDQTKAVVIEIAMGLIASISDHDGEPEELILPGFIDIHNHGAIGVDINAANADQLLKVSRFLATNGVTGWLPTIVPDSPENYRKAIEAIDAAMSAQPGEPIAQILGVHYEGVFANASMCGALHEEYFREFTSIDELHSLPLPASGIRMMTFAPEIKGGVALTRALVEERWIPSIGHTDADTAVLESAFSAGARHLTHFFNAMKGLHHRNLGVVGWALTKKNTTFDIIADGIHVHPSIIRLAVSSKGPGSVSLISDSIAPTGLGDGEYEVWGERISVANGRTSNSSGSIAGSVITIDDAFKNVRLLGFSLLETSQMTSRNPSRLLGLNDSVGTIEVGKRADLVVCNADLEIEKVFVGGRSL